MAPSHELSLEDMLLAGLQAGAQVAHRLAAELSRTGELLRAHALSYGTGPRVVFLALASPARTAAEDKALRQLCTRKSRRRVQGGATCGSMLGRVAHLLPCPSSWLCLDVDSFDEDARLILSPPQPALAECLIPPSAALAFEPRERGGDAAPGAAVWDPAAGKLGAIELKEAAQNPLLGLGHLAAGGRFVSAKVAAPPPSGAGGAPDLGSDAAGTPGMGFGPRTPRGSSGREAGGGGRAGAPEELDWDAAEGEGLGLELGDLPNPQVGGDAAEGGGLGLELGDLPDPQCGGGGAARSPARSPRAARWPPREHFAATGA